MTGVPYSYSDTTREGLKVIVYWDEVHFCGLKRIESYLSQTAIINKHVSVNKLHHCTFSPSLIVALKTRMMRSVKLNMHQKKCPISHSEALSLCKFRYFPPRGRHIKGDCETVINRFESETTHIFLFTRYSIIIVSPRSQWGRGRSSLLPGTIS